MAFAPGQLYSGNWDDDGTYRVVKILVSDDDAVHVRVYKQRFQARPTTVEPQHLTLGGVHDPDGFGVGHLPLAHHEFMLWEPELIGSTELREEELDGYRIWASEPDAEVFGTSKRTLRNRIRGWLGRE